MLNYVAHPRCGFNDQSGRDEGVCRAGELEAWEANIRAIGADPSWPLSRIIERYMEVNGLVPEKIEEAGTYVVKSGDSLFKIAEAEYADGWLYTLIAEANGIENPDLIEVGQELVIPDLS